MHHSVADLRGGGGGEGETEGGGGEDPPTSHGSASHLQGPYLPRNLFITAIRCRFSISHDAFHPRCCFSMSPDAFHRKATANGAANGPANSEWRMARRTANGEQRSEQ